MRQRRKPRGFAGLATAGWWLRFLAAALFIFQTGYIRYHLLTEVHYDVATADVVDATAQHDDDDDGDHHHSDHHKPHSADNHLTQLLAKRPSSLLLADYFVGPQTSVHFTQPDAVVVRIFLERIETAGESPPDPLQPRAPPLA